MKKVPAAQYPSQPLSGYSQPSSSYSSQGTLSQWPPILPHPLHDFEYYRNFPPPPIFNKPPPFVSKQSPSPGPPFPPSPTPYLSSNNNHFYQNPSFPNDNSHGNPIYGPNMKRRRTSTVSDVDYNEKLSPNGLYYNHGDGFYNRQYSSYHNDQRRNFNTYHNQSNHYSHYQNNSYQQPNQTSTETSRSITPREDDKNTDADKKQSPKTVIIKKKKKAMSQSYPSPKWNREDAEKALRAEQECKGYLKNPALIIRFPDPELNTDIVKKLHPAIENVKFHQPSVPRHCFVRLKKHLEIDRVIRSLQTQRFGNGFLHVEERKDLEEDPVLQPEDINPYVLYVGNLSNNVKKEDLEKLYVSCSRLDIGYAQRMKYTRYAFVRFNSVDDAISAFRRTHNILLDSRSLIVKFRRTHGKGGPNDSSKLPKSTNEKTVQESPADTTQWIRKSPMDIKKEIKEEPVSDDEYYDADSGIREDLNSMDGSVVNEAIKMEPKRELAESRPVETEKESPCNYEEEDDEEDEMVYRSYDQYFSRPDDEESDEEVPNTSLEQMYNKLCEKRKNIL